MPLPPTMHEFARESRMILGRLVRSRSGLRRAGSPKISEWRFPGRSRSQPSAAVIAEMLARSLLQELPDGTLGPTAAGLKLLEGGSGGQTLLAAHADVLAPTPVSPGLNQTESAVSWLGRRAGRSGKPLLSEEQLAAAELIRADYERARLGARVTALWEGRTGTAPAARPASPSEQAYEARERVFRALDAVGPELSGIILEVCCLASGLEQAERRLSLPSRAGKTVLQLALTALARHYGFYGRRRGGRESGELARWALPDFRPSIPEP